MNDSASVTTEPTLTWGDAREALHLGTAPITSRHGKRGENQKDEATFVSGWKTATHPARGFCSTSAEVL